MFRNIEELLQRGILACRWYGQEFSQADQYTRLDKTFLYVLMREADGYWVRRLIGFEETREDTGEPFITYSLEPLFRITESTLDRRRGRVLPLRLLWDKESARPAGLKKKLRKGSFPDQLDPQRAGDNYLLMTLDELESALRNHSIEVGTEMPLPRFFLCGSQVDKMYLRTHSRVRACLQGLSGYDNGKTLSENFRKLHLQLAQDAGDARKAYPYELVYGKGVRVVGKELNEGWFLVSTFRALRTEDWIRVDIRPTMEDCKSDPGSVAEKRDGD